ncbi:10576_t:CDS:2, partial [Dentiscutata heterogama]
NTIVKELFERRWEALKLKYTSASVNSTQCVENLNHKIYSYVGSNSLLLELVKEIQDIFNKESNYMRIEKYKSEISKVRLATVPRTYFNLIEPIISQYLIPTMVFKQEKSSRDKTLQDKLLQDKLPQDELLQDELSQDELQKNDEFNIGNLIITVRRERPPGRAKSTIEI